MEQYHCKVSIVDFFQLSCYLEKLQQLRVVSIFSDIILFFAP